MNVERLERDLLWRLFCRVAPLTGVVLGVTEPAEGYSVLPNESVNRLILWGYIRFDLEGEFFVITEAGDDAIRRVHKRNVWKKNSWDSWGDSSYLPVVEDTLNIPSRGE